VLAIAPDRLAEFEAICARERCPFAVVGRATASSGCASMTRTSAMRRWTWIWACCWATAAHDARRAPGRARAGAAFL